MTKTLELSRLRVAIEQVLDRLESQGCSTISLEPPFMYWYVAPDQARVVSETPEPVLGDYEEDFGLILNEGTEEGVSYNFVQAIAGVFGYLALGRERNFL